MPKEELGMMEEHKAPPKDEDTSSKVYSPSDKDKKAIKLVNTKFEKAKKHRSKYDERWMDWYEMFRGKHWREPRPSYRHSEVINFIFQEIQSVVPILTDAKPRSGFLPVEPGDRELVSIIEQIYDYEWRRNNWGNILTEIIYEAHLYGTGYGKVDGKVVDGQGKVEFESADPFYCFPDPSAYDMNRNGSFFIYAEPLDIEKAKKKYKSKAEFIKADLTDLVGQDKTHLGKARFQSPIDKKTAYDEAEDFGPDITQKDQTLDITLWMRDDEVEEVKEKRTDEEGKEKDVFVQKLKFPRGREIKVVGGVLIYDREYPYNDFRERFSPFARIQNYILPREFFGISEVEQLESPQKIFNKLVSFALDVLTLMGNPIWVVDSTSGVDVDLVTNRPGLVIEKEPNSIVRREEGVQLQPYVMALIDRMQSWFNEVSGATDITRGQRPEGVTAAAAIRTLQEASQTRLRLKSRLIDSLLQEIGQMYLARMFQFYTAPMMFRVTGDENVFRYYKLSVEEGEEDKKLVRVTEVVEEPGMAPIEGEVKAYETYGKFDVIVTTGSTLPFAREEKIGLALRLHQQGIIDAEEVLNAADYPNKEQVIERLKQQQEAVAQQAAMQGPPVA